MKFPFLLFIFYLEVIICTSPIIKLSDTIPNGIVTFPSTTLGITTKSEVVTTSVEVTTTSQITTQPDNTETSIVSVSTTTTNLPTTSQPVSSTSTETTKVPSSFSTAPVSSESTDTTKQSSNSPTTTTPTTTTTLPTTTLVPTLKLSDNNPYLPWNPMIDGDFETIEAELGYKIRVELVACDIDGENGEFVKISTSENFDSPDTLFITYTADNFKPFLFNSNILYATFSGTEASNFTANFSRIGELLTTVSTEVPSTTIILPTPGANDSYELTVFLGGKSADEYKNKDVQKSLKGMILNMATEYCNTENFKLAEEITTNNIILEEIVECSINWPDYKKCITLTFSVPIDLQEDPKRVWEGYQLTSQHLRIMWDTYAKKYLIDGLYIYSPPDSTSWLKVQLILFSSITVFFVICLIVIRQVSLKISKAIMTRRRLSDATSIISSERHSEFSLPPHYLQETPPLFDNTYMMYSPNKAYEPSLSEHFGYNYGYPNFSDLSMGVENNEDNDDWDSDTSPIQESGA